MRTVYKYTNLIFFSLSLLIIESINKSLISFLYLEICLFLNLINIIFIIIINNNKIKKKINSSLVEHNFENNLNFKQTGKMKTQQFFITKLNIENITGV